MPFLKNAKYFLNGRENVLQNSKVVIFPIKNLNQEILQLQQFN